MALAQVHEMFFLVGLFLFGLVFGSFANVVIWRYPRGESLGSPSSHCPSCGHPVRPRDNVPVFSWILLRGRCRDCNERISKRYPLVELLSGALWLAAGLQWGLTPRMVAGISFFFLLLILSFIDIDTMRLPNPLVGILAVIGLLGAVASQLLCIDVVPLLDVAGTGLLSHPLGFSAVGVLVGVGLSLGMALLYSLLRGAKGLGMGDIKFLGSLGLFLGPYVVGALFAGSMFAVGFAGLQAVAGKSPGEGLKAKVPFGPFLAIGAVTMSIWGAELWAWYAGLISG